MGSISLILLAILAVPTLQEKIYSSGLKGYLWNYDVCPLISKLRGSLQECEDVCTLNDGCTAFNFVSAGVDTRCELLKCPVPIPKPGWNYGQGWIGYFQVTEQGECNCVKKELERIREHQAHLEKLIKEQGKSHRGTLKEELDRLKEHLEKLLKEQGDSQRETMQDELGSMKELHYSMSDSISSISKNISSLTETLMANTTLHKECSDIEDGFESGGKCYKIIREKKASWYDAKDMCTAKGLKIAGKPSDPIGLRKYIVDTYVRTREISSIVNVWLNAKGDGSGRQYLWQHDSSSLSFRDPLFLSSEPSPGQERGRNGCLHLIGTTYHMSLQPNSPYAGGPCHSTATHYALCEV